MIYKVKKKIIEEKIPEFFSKLTDGTISNQKPNGQEIVAAMKRAVIDNSGMSEWHETCFCQSPLQHERETQLDLYSTDLNTELAEKYGEVNGVSLWSYMVSRSDV